MGVAVDTRGLDGHSSPTESFTFGSLSSALSSGDSTTITSTTAKDELLSEYVCFVPKHLPDLPISPVGAKRKLRGKRRQRAKLVRSTASVGTFDYSPNSYVAACGVSEAACFETNSGSIHDCGWSKVWEPDNDMEEQVIVAVEATAICALEFIEKNWFAATDLSYPLISGTNFVGIVHNCGPDAEKLGFTTGQRVAAIMKWGANARFVSIPPEHLTVVPKNLDCSEIACIIAAYLPAFQALRHGEPKKDRYSRTKLLGKRLLVTGGGMLEVQALIRLAKWAGITEINVVAPSEHHALFDQSRVRAFEEDPELWLPKVRNAMDIVIDYGFPRHFFAVQESLSASGRLVCNAPREQSDTFARFAGVDLLFQQYMLAIMPRGFGTLFDFAANVMGEREELWRDLSFLLKLLADRQIRPEIDRFVSLNDVISVYKEVKEDRRLMRGAIICEPWKSS